MSHSKQICGNLSKAASMFNKGVTLAANAASAGVAQSFSLQQEQKRYADAAVRGSIYGISYGVVMSPAMMLVLGMSFPMSVGLTMLGAGVVCFMGNAEPEADVHHSEIAMTRTRTARI